MNKQATSQKSTALRAIAFIFIVALTGCAPAAESKQHVQLTSTNSSTTTAIALVTSTTSATPLTTRAPVVTTEVPTTRPPTTAAATPTTSSYTNVDGNKIESPDANTGGATGVCNDGTYTHAVHHQGACSSHGGVNHWL